MRQRELRALQNLTCAEHRSLPEATAEGRLAQAGAQELECRQSGGPG